MTEEGVMGFIEQLFSQDNLLFIFAIGLGVMLGLILATAIVALVTIVIFLTAGITIRRILGNYWRRYKEGSFSTKEGASPGEMDGPAKG